MSFKKIELQLGDIKRWKANMSSVDPASMPPEEFQSWIVSQLRNELAPLMEAGHKATTEELVEMSEEVEEVSAAVDEIINHTDSFIQEEMAENLISTLELGASICEMAMALDSSDELAKKKLTDSVGHYVQMAVVMIDQVRMASEDEDEEEEKEGNGGDEDEPTGSAGSGLHDQGGDTEGTDPGGEGSTGGSGSGSGSTEETGSGSE